MVCTTYAYESYSLYVRSIYRLVTFEMTGDEIKDVLEDAVNFFLDEVSRKVPIQQWLGAS